MKNKINFLILILLFGINFSASAKKWRVNNTLDVPTQVHFNELKAAVESPMVASGDTIYVEGSSTPYQGGIKIYKKLIIIGPGYVLDQPNLQPTLVSHLPATIGGVPGISILEGSDGTYITGLSIISEFGAPVSIEIENTSNITITRNRMETIKFLNGTSNPSPTTNICSNIFISRNLICDNIYLGCRVSINTIWITNNLIGRSIETGCSPTTNTNIEIGMVSNNTFLNNSNNFIWIKGSIISFNYVGWIDSEPENTFISNNIMSISNTNSQQIVNENPTNVIDPYDDTDFTCSYDNWQMQPNDETGDHGAFNGNDPYYNNNPVSPANLPAWPVIYDCEIVSDGDSTLQVNFSVRSND